jgi:hypothetical protein
MDNKEAIKIAKDYVAEIFADEGVKNLGLEEIQHDNGTWEITIGFTRNWQRGNDAMSPLNPLLNIRPDRRTFKVVKIDERKKEVVSMEEPYWARR